MKEKKLIRDNILLKLAKVEDFSKKDEGIYKVFFENYEILIPKDATTIAAYIPCENEYNVFPILKELTNRGHKIVVPFMKNEENIDFCYWKEGDLLEKCKNFPKISEPKNKAIANDFKVIIVPLVGCDASGNRIGRGKGIYDRKIDELQRSNLDIISIGLAYEEQISNRIPTEDHDKRLNYIVSEKNIFVTLRN